MERRSPRQRKHSQSATSTPKATTVRGNYYAGARFETTPTLSALPTPPVRWTMTSPTLRSQSTPTSPITTTMMGDERRQPMTTPVTPTVFKSASFPGDSSLMSLFRVRGEPLSLSSNHAHAQSFEVKRPAPASPPANAKVEEKVDLIQMLIQASPKREQEPELKPQEKKMIKEVTPVKLIPRSPATPCHLQFNNCGQEYKNVSDHLKSLLKVSA